MKFPKSIIEESMVNRSLDLVCSIFKAILFVWLIKLKLIFESSLQVKNANDIIF